MKITESMQRLLRAKNITVVDTINNDRYVMVIGTIGASKQPIIFKAAPPTAPNFLLSQRNTVVWTRTMQESFKPSSQFGIAPIIEDGFTDGWYWYIMPFIKGMPLATADGDVTRVSAKDFNEVLPRLVLLLHHIQKTTALSVNGLDARFGSVGRRDKLRLLEEAINWARHDTPHLSELLQIISANYQSLGTANAHGDFTETNIIINEQRQPILIDAEISDAQMYKYYDVAEFYHRLFTRACAPDLARQFLKTYVASLRKQSKRLFMQNFYCLSAYRCIGTWMEVNTLSDNPSKQQRLLYARRFAESIVTHRILHD